MNAKKIEDLKARRSSASKRSQIVSDATERERLHNLVVRLTRQIHTLQNAR
jgi:hypothetical protein